MIIHSNSMINFSKNKMSVRPMSRLQNTASKDLLFSRCQRNKNKTILVTGGTGYIGSIFVDTYAKAHPNHKIVIVARNTSKLSKFPNNVEIIKADYGNQIQMEAILREYQVSQVVHLAAVAGSNTYENISKTEALFNAMELQGVRQLVYSSSLMIYEPLPLEYEKIYEEAAKVEPDSNSYASSKLAIEDMIFNKKNWRSIILRYSIGIGTNQDQTIGDTRPYQPILNTIIKAIMDGQILRLPDDGTARKDLVDVQDLADATGKSLAWLAKEDNPSVVVLNAGSGKSYSTNEMVEAVEEFSGRKLTVERASHKPAHPIVLNIDLINKVLNWKPLVSLNTSIRNTWNFLLQSSPATNGSAA